MRVSVGGDYSLRTGHLAELSQGMSDISLAIGVALVVSYLVLIVYTI